MNANIFEFQNKENLMQFNPLFLPANNFAENPGITKAFKLSNSTYLFSDIINVFAGTDLIKNQENTGLNLPQNNLPNQQLQAANIYSLYIQNPAAIPGKHTSLSKTNNSAVNNLNIIIDLINKLSGCGQLNLQGGISGLNSFKSGILSNEKIISSDELTPLLNNLIKLFGSENITGNGDKSKEKNKVDDNPQDLIINILNSLNANKPVIINIVSKNENLKIELQKTDILGEDEKSISLNHDDSNSGVSLKEDKFDLKLVNNTGYKESLHIPEDPLSIEAMESLSSENGRKIVSDGQSKIELTGKVDNISPKDILLQNSASPAEQSINSDSVQFVKLNSGSNTQNIFKLKVEISKIEKPSHLPGSEITPDLSNKIFGKSNDNLSKNVLESVSIEKLVASKNSMKSLNKVPNELNNYSIRSAVNKIKNPAFFKNENKNEVKSEIKSEIKSELKIAKPIVKNTILKSEIQFNDSIKSKKDLNVIVKVSNKDLKETSKISTSGDKNNVVKNEIKNNNVKIELEDSKSKPESGVTKPLNASAKAKNPFIENVTDQKILLNVENVDNDKLNEKNKIPAEKTEIQGEIIKSVKSGVEDKKSSHSDVQKTDDVADEKHVSKEKSITSDTKTKTISTNIESNNSNDSKEMSVSKADDNQEILASGKTVIETDSQKSNSEFNNIANIKNKLSDKINFSDKQLNDNFDDNLINNKKDDTGNSKDEEQFSQSKGDNFFSSYLNKIEMNNVQSLKRPDYKENFDDQMKKVDSSELVKEITKLAADSDQKNVVLKLIPEDLGKVKISLDISNNIIHAHAEVENEAAKILMQNNVDILKQSLVQQGLQLNSLNISLANHQEQKSNKPFVSKRKALFNEQIREISDEETQTVSKNYGYNTYEFLA